jgi:colicin import membrane protein
MARKLKTFQTSLGFYDLAIAAPSMKAALDAWGAGSNLFHQGIAKETNDPDVVAATMSKPGVVLKRPAGSGGRFAEHSDLPSDLGSARQGRRRERHRAKPAKKPPPEVSQRDARTAAAEFEKEQKRREAEQRREEAARERDRERREKATAKAQAAMDKAEREHAKKASEIQAEVEALEKRSRAEDDRWEKERERLQAALRRARE